MTETSSGVENYLKEICVLIEEKGHAKTNDISKRLGVSPASVTEMLQRLSDKELIFYKKYAGVTLTKKGEKIAKDVKKRYITIKRLLHIVQVPESIAEKDACEMEHHLDPKTIRQLVKFVDFVENCPIKLPKWRECFKLYCETGQYSECEDEK